MAKKGQPRGGSKKAAAQGKAMVQAATGLAFGTAKKVLNVMAAAAARGGAQATVQVQKARALPRALPVPLPRTRKFQFGQGRPNTVAAQRRAAGAVRSRQTAWFQKVQEAGQRLRQKVRGIAAHHANLGPMGEFPDTIVLEIRADNALQGHDVPAELNPTSLRGEIRALVINPLVAYGNALIEQYAPKETGALQRAMKAKLVEGENTVDGFPHKPIEVYLGTPGVPYAKPVNKMPRSWIRHTGDVWSYRSRSWLFDPTAMEGWFTLCLRDIQQKAEALWTRQFIGTQTGGYLYPLFDQLRAAGMFPNTLAELKKLFKVKFSPTRRW